MAKYINQIFICILMSLFIFASGVSVYAEDNMKEEIPEGYIAIYTKEDLNNMKNNLSGNYILMNDIEFSVADFEKNGAFYNNNKGWQPIAQGGLSFTGTFDGNNHYIKGLTINLDEITTEGTSAGLFGNFSGIVLDLSLIDVNISIFAERDICVGAIAGELINGDIINCCVSGNIKAETGEANSYSYNVVVGGMFGEGHNSNISEVSNYVTIDTKANGYGGIFAGGVCGSINGGTIKSSVNYGKVNNCSNIEIEMSCLCGGISAIASDAEINECSNYGDVEQLAYTKIGSNCAGGIVGKSDLSIIRRCKNAGNISATASKQEGYTTMVGGIVGEAYYTSESVERNIIQSCYNIGTIYAESLISIASSGGIVGACYTYSLENCFNTGKVTASSDSNSVGGGIAGYIQEVDCCTCYNTGEVVCEIAGGIIGDFFSGTINSCFYLDNNLVGVGNGTDYANICTYDEMQNQQTFIGFNFEHIWKMGIDKEGLPVFSFDDSCDHELSFISSKESSCNSYGNVVYYTCIKCNQCFDGNTKIPIPYAAVLIGKTEHIIEVDKAVKATCEKEGISEGSHCSVCNTVLVKQNLIDKLGHDMDEEWRVTKDPTCTENGEKRKDCSRCDYYVTEEIEQTSHEYQMVTTAATLEENGSIENICVKCGDIENEIEIYYPKTIKLSTTKFIYDGKSKKPIIVVEDAKGKALEKGTDYDINGTINRTSVGRAKITITFKGKYSGTKNLYYTIVPSKPSSISINLNTVSGGYDDVKFSWNKCTGATGYNVYYRKSTNQKYVYLATTTKTSIIKKNLSDGQKYYFKVIPYYENENIKYYDSTQYKTGSIYTLKKVSLSSIARSGSKVKVKWKNINGETGYQISKSTKKNGTNIVSTYKTTKGTYKTINAAKGKTYYYKVRAYKIVNGKKVYGPWSTAKKYKR